MTNLIWVITSTALIIAVIVIRALLGKKMSAGLRYALWGLVLLRLLVPGTIFSSPVSVKSAAERTETVQNFQLLQGVDSIAYNQNGTVEGLSWQRPSQDTLPSADDPETTQVPVISTITEQTSPERFERMKATIKVRDILKIVWLVGVGFSVVCFTAANIRFYVQMRERRVKVEGSFSHPVYAVRGLTSSCLFLGTIYLQDDTAEDPVKLRHIVAHECAHFRHGDHIWTLLRCVALALHWYNPLVWISALLSRQDSELFADAGAIKTLGGDVREDYGVTLIELAAAKPINPNMFCAATMMTNGKHELRERIKSIASNKKASVIAVAATLLLCAAAASCSFMGSRVAAEKPIPDTVRIAADLDGDGANEYFVLDSSTLLSEGVPVRPRIENEVGNILGELDEISTSHAGYNTYAVVKEGERNYILEYTPQTYGDINEFGYKLFTLENGKPAVARQNSVEFDLPIGRPAGANDNEAILAFVNEANGLFANASIIVSTDSYNVLASGMYYRESGESFVSEDGDPFIWTGKTPAVTYREGIRWLDENYSVYSDYDPNATLEEKLEYVNTVLERSRSLVIASEYFGLSDASGGSIFRELEDENGVKTYIVHFAGHKEYIAICNDTITGSWDSLQYVPGGETEHTDINYDQNDVAILRTFFEERDQNGVTNGSKLFIAYDANDPDTWRGEVRISYIYTELTWDRSNGRLTGMTLSPSNPEVTRLTGTLDLTGLTALNKLIISDLTIGSIRSLDNPALSEFKMWSSAALGDVNVSTTIKSAAMRLYSYSHCALTLTGSSVSFETNAEGGGAAGIQTDGGDVLLVTAWPDGIYLDGWTDMSGPELQDYGNYLFIAHEKGSAWTAGRYSAAARFLRTARGSVANVNITDVESELYTQQEIEDAMRAMFDYFENNFYGCTLTDIRYAGDDEVRAYLGNRDLSDYPKVIILASDFTAGPGSDGALGEPGTEWQDFQWIIVQNSDGQWVHLDHGY